MPVCALPRARRLPAAYAREPGPLTAPVRHPLGRHRFAWQPVSRKPGDEVAKATKATKTEKVDKAARVAAATP
ncbi:hypothetical protein GCM10009680_75040 [Streptomyces yatensis]|uniref:Uncharacterized protein n=1 Tax=Streptomyces yatensis TaxID=155177 RepID=A0ABN2JC59_9ACTN